MNASIWITGLSFVTKNSDRLEFKGFTAIYHATNEAGRKGWEVIDADRRSIKFNIKTKGAVLRYIKLMNQVPLQVRQMILDEAAFNANGANLRPRWQDCMAS
jgi:hypothetical protein